MLRVLIGRTVFAYGKIRQVNAALFSDKCLFMSNMMISASLSVVGDAVEQKLVKTRQTGKDEDFDYVRSRNMCISGITVGLLTHKWYRWLDGKYPGRAMAIVLKKVLLDTIVFSPMQIVVFFVTMGVLEKSRVQQVKKDIVEKGKLLYLVEWMVWAPLQMLNFQFLPSQYRVLFDNSLSLINDIYVSYVTFDHSS